MLIIIKCIHLYNIGINTISHLCEPLTRHPHVQTYQPLHVFGTQFGPLIHTVVENDTT